MRGKNFAVFSGVDYNGEYDRSGNMKVVLIQEVPGLGNVGDVKEVSGGYGRNYLLPRRMAEFATPESLKRTDALRAAEEKRQQALNMEMADVAKKIEGLEIKITAKVGGQDRLYGSVTAADIAAQVQNLVGLEIDKRKVMLVEAIHKVGEYEAAIKLSRDLAPKVKIIVVGEKAEEKSAEKAEGAVEAKAEEKPGEAPVQ
jgi:large subunit ribosomal protein L9